MKTLTIGELKANFSDVLSTVLKTGEAVVISYGKKKTRVAALIPIDQMKSGTPRKLGALAGQAVVQFQPDFAITDEEFLAS